MYPVLEQKSALSQNLSAYVIQIVLSLEVNKSLGDEIAF